MRPAMGMMEVGRAMRPAEVRVWDRFVRMFHWSLVAVYIAAWITADEWDLPHEIAGYVVVVLTLLRAIWGFAGPRHARFVDFVRGPRTVLGYLKDVLNFRAARHLGHNPAGGAMVVLLLLALAGVSVTGVMLTLDGLRGYHRVLEDMHELFANGTLALVCLHIAGVVLTSFQHRENLVRSMCTGLKRSGD